MSEFFEEDRSSTLDALLEVQKIIFGPVMFQVVRTLINLDILKMAYESRRKGLSMAEFRERVTCSNYGLEVLLEAALALGIFTKKANRYYITKVGYFLCTDERNRIHINLMENVCYEGFAHLDESIRHGEPKGLQVFGHWKTIYEALPTLPPKTQTAWLEWDHFHSDSAFPDALKKVFTTPPKTLLDVGGNTGKWAVACCDHDSSIRIGIVDLPGQLEMADRDLRKHGIRERVDFHPADMLDPASQLPAGYDAIWMSQFLTCFSEDEIVSILEKTKSAMGEITTLYILEPFWDLQHTEAAAFSMICISLYFTCFANGNSKIYRSDAMVKCIEKSGLEVCERFQVGDNHTLLACRIKNP